MAKVRVDFIKSIAKFKKSDLKKPTGQINMKNKLKWIDVLSKYARGEEYEYPENIKELFSVFLSTLVEVHITPEVMEQIKGKDELLLNYFVLFNRYKKPVKNVDKIKNLILSEEEKTLALSILTNFYNTTIIKDIQQNIFKLTPKSFAI